MPFEVETDADAASLCGVLVPGWIWGANGDGRLECEDGIQDKNRRVQTNQLPEVFSNAARKEGQVPASLRAAVGQLSVALSC